MKSSNYSNSELDTKELCILNLQSARIHADMQINLLVKNYNRVTEELYHSLLQQLHNHKKHLEYLVSPR